ncbi:hypothetical protein TrST_g535 [Triparma strigata]|uniref:Uncharacterized protein n=1 Tax=Triparma strigata TaxID=1606541 RepID=A0A9W7A7B7_9STRA|nr:hypothetical protein TrST_g535 [Triparma strigata]
MKLLLLVLASATSAAAFGTLPKPLCERAANGNPDDFCEEWTMITDSGACWEQCSPEELDYESMVYDATFKCSMDSTDQMEADSEGQLSGSCDDAAQVMLTWSVTDACTNPNALPDIGSPAPPGWFQFVCCHYCMIGTNTEV